jgi:hypothetical protein
MGIRLEYAHRNDNRETRVMKSIRLSLLSLASGVLALSAVHAPAQALDKVHVGNPSDIAWAFVPPYVGIETGIFKKYDLDVDVASFGGARRCSKLSMPAASISASAAGRRWPSWSKARR